jgi:hypothetical protein
MIMGIFQIIASFSIGVLSMITYMYFAAKLVLAVAEFLE